MSHSSPTPSRPPLSQYWSSELVPDYIVDLCNTFRDRNPDFDHRVFSELEAERFIGERFGARELAAFRACAVPAMQADYFRYCVVLALGGIYADADFICLRSLRPLLNRCAGGELFFGPGEQPLNGHTAGRMWNGLFAFREPGHPLLQLALEIATTNIELRWAERIWPAGEKVVWGIWLSAGPGVFTLLGLMWKWGSFDAFREGVVGSPMQRFADRYCETVGDYSRIAEAFEGVRVASHEDLHRWVAHPDYTLPYKETDLHWHNVKTSIFR